MILNFHNCPIFLRLHQHGVDGAVILERLDAMDAKIAELVQASKDAATAAAITRDAVAAIPPAIDKLEAAITDLKTKTNLSPEDAAAVDGAIADARSVVTAATEATTTATTAATDAADNIDEAAPGLTPTP